VPSLQNVYFTIEAIVPTITETVSHLAGLFGNLDISTDQFAEFAKRGASAFSEISESATQPSSDLEEVSDMSVSSYRVAFSMNFAAASLTSMAGVGSVWNFSIPLRPGR
jgi:hypothetical protein